MTQHHGCMSALDFGTWSVPSCSVPVPRPETGPSPRSVSWKARLSFMSKCWSCSSPRATSQLPLEAVQVLSGRGPEEGVTPRPACCTTQGLVALCVLAQWDPPCFSEDYANLNHSPASIAVTLSLWPVPHLFLVYQTQHQEMLLLPWALLSPS